MVSTVKKAGATVFAAAALFGTVAGPASAQQNGLVNVDISNVLNNNNVQVTVPINAAANVCGVSVAVLANDLLGGPVTCNAGANQQFTVLGMA